MEHLARPAARLQHFVRCYVQLDVRLPNQPVFLPIPARSAPILEFTLGDPNEVLFTEHTRHERAHAVNVVGVQTYRRVHLSMRGNLDTFAVVFQPGGLSALLSVPADALTNQHFDGRAVCGAWVDDLRTRLGSSSSFAERVRHVDQCLLQRAPAAGTHREVTVAARALLSRSGNLRISDLVAQSRLSARQFERVFASRVGMSPKVYARVVRFEAALKRKKEAPALRWTDVAHEVGYYDHMHMVHDFQLLAGATPSSLAPEVDRIVPPENERAGRSDAGVERVSLHPLLA